MWTDFFLPHFPPFLQSLLFGRQNGLIASEKQVARLLRSKVRIPLRTCSWLWKFDHMWEDFVNSLPVVVGILRVVRFPPTRKVDRVG